jgi:hypothetical protein
VGPPSSVPTAVPGENESSLEPPRLVDARPWLGSRPASKRESEIEAHRGKTRRLARLNERALCLHGAVHGLELGHRGIRNEKPFLLLPGMKTLIPTRAHTGSPRLGVRLAGVLSR